MSIFDSDYVPVHKRSEQNIASSGAGQVKQGGEAQRISIFDSNYIPVRDRPAQEEKALPVMPSTPASTRTSAEINFDISQAKKEKAALIMEHVPATVSNTSKLVNAHDLPDLTRTRGLPQRTKSFEKPVFEPYRRKTGFLPVKMADINVPFLPDALYPDVDTRANAGYNLWQRITKGAGEKKFISETLTNKTNSNVAYLQNFLAQIGATDETNNPLKVDGVYGNKTQLALADYPELVKFGKDITTSAVAAKTDSIISDWDEKNLTQVEQQEINRINMIMQDAMNRDDFKGIQQAYQQEEAIRSKYRLSFECTDITGKTYISASKLNEFSENAMKKYGTEATVIPPYVIAGAIASQIDSPVPGPADIAGLLIIAGGFIISKAVAFFSKGKSDPKDLKKGMTQRQKEKYYEAIHKFKRGSGIPPNGNLPWEILVALAEEVKELFKKG